MSVVRRLSSSGMVTKASTMRKVASSVAERVTFRKQLDDAWEVGCCYQTATVVKLWPSTDMASSPLGALAVGHEVHIVQVIEGPAVTIAFVLPRHQMQPGWILLEDRRLAGPQPVLRVRVPQFSWSLRGRYSVLQQTTMRESSSLLSPSVGTLDQMDEVLLLDVGINEDAEKEAPRLRLKVASVRGLVGWVTAITSDDDRLVDTQNLLSPEMVQIRASARKRSSGVFASAVSKTKSYESSAAGAAGRWLPNGDYRVLQAADLKEEPRADSGLIARVRPGTIVHLVNLCRIEENQRQMAFVTVCPDHTIGGYTFLKSPAGFDVIDNRDLSEVSKVEAWLAMRAEEDEEKERDDEAETGSEEAGDDESSATSLEAAESPAPQAAAAAPEKPKKRTSEGKATAAPLASWKACAPGGVAGCFSPMAKFTAQAAH